MGRRIPVVSYLCGILHRRRNPTDSNSRTKTSPSSGDNSSPEHSTTNVAAPTHEDALTNQTVLPPPPGRIQSQMLRSSSSCHYQHNRSNSIVSKYNRSNSVISKLTSSLSMRVLPLKSDGGGGGGGGGKNMKKFKHEDSIWKKTIILGEKCRVPDENDEDTILYDENGKRIAKYHQRTDTFSHQNLMS